MQNQLKVKNVIQIETLSRKKMFYFRSVQHENLYINPWQKFCFMQSPPSPTTVNANENEENDKVP